MVKVQYSVISTYNDYNKKRKTLLNLKQSVAKSEVVKTMKSLKRKLKFVN